MKRYKIYSNTYLRVSKDIKRLIYSLICACVMISCSDYLDKDSQVDTTLTYEMIFKDVHLAPGFLNNIYNTLPDGFSRYGGPLLASASDEAKNSVVGGGIQNFNNGAISPSNNPDDVWETMYAGIRKCNIFLKEVAEDGLIVKYNSISEANRPNYVGQALFLRAFFHFELLKRYQNIPYVDQILDPNDVEEVYSFRQLDFLDVVERIVADCDSAITCLPARITNDGDRGRSAQAAPMALKSRVLLYAASPLNNPTGDITMWERAEAAAKAIYDSRSALGLSLQSNYSSIFDTPYNSEIIFSTSADNRNDIESYNFPPSFQGQGLTNPTQNLVDAYVMNGSAYANPMNGYNPENPYQGREIRFGMTILYNNVTFKGENLQTFVGGKDGLYSNSNATKTGYYLNKFVASSISLELGQTVRRPWILFRYAEVLLNYAEARNEVLDQPDATIHTILNLIRDRANLRTFTAATYITDKDEMREYIKKERQVELAMEEHRFWDLRRWKDAETVLNGPIQGMRIERTQTGIDEEGDPVYQFTYNEFNVEYRTFDPKMYWYPIPRTEMLKYKNKGVDFKQNPGWE